MKRLERALEVAMERLKQSERVFRHHGFNGPADNNVMTLAEIDAILHPVEVEEVPLVQWAVVAPSGYVECTFGSEDTAIQAILNNMSFNNYNVVKLTGTIRREKKVVERSVSFTADWTEDEGGPVYPCVVDTEFDFEYLVGKTGTLTFEWTE